VLEKLENRQLFAMTSVLASGVLTITGTTGNDSLYVSYQLAGNKINVNDYSTIKPFDRALVKKIVVIGKEGHDSLWVNSNLGNIPTSIDGGAGDDRLYTPEGNDTLVGGLGLDVLNSGGGNDKLDGGDGNDQLNGGNGNDTLLGGAGNDTIHGNGGNDSIDGGLGADDMHGDDGTDIVTYASRTSAVTVDITEKIGELADDGQSGEKDFVRASVENLAGGSGNDKFTGTVTTLTTTGLTRNNTFYGNGGNDTLFGLDGNDKLDGGSGNDSIDGGVGNDTLIAGLGTDKVIGGAGTDTADYSARSENLKLDLDGIADDGASGENDMLYADLENLTGGKGNDWIVGNGLNNVVRGGAGNDTLEGSSGNDTIYGDAGIDKIYGQSGNDTIYARKPSTSTLADNDTVDGGIGTDKAQVDSTDKKVSIESLLA
jgi:Ca2+-binding RTX toxin-like protein